MVVLFIQYTTSKGYLEILKRRSNLTFEEKTINLK